MIKLKQILLEATMGDCYPAGGNLIIESHPDKNYKLVHGMVNGQGSLEGRRYGHCWVELAGKVLDHSNGQKLELPKSAYYAIGRINPKECKYYTRKEALTFILDTGQWGPWEMSGDTVMAEDMPDASNEIGKQDLRISSNELEAIKSIR